jgi:hypothetical protein
MHVWVVQWYDTNNSLFNSMMLQLQLSYDHMSVADVFFFYVLQHTDAEQQPHCCNADIEPLPHATEHQGLFFILMFG